MKKKTSDFKDDILKLRDEGVSYENIAIWLAENKRFAVTGSAIRAFVKKQQMLDALSK
ncbi:hypothetical protein CH62_4367 (plasmid) [Yersinia pestis]|jgi:hypothetical protein|uniref:Transposase n=1 Tax=Yersinia pestis Java 9 TaxID=880632 RepID=E8PSH5_YERPE|nr:MULTISPECIES: hypothetical protein [Enterobacterales]ADW66975.1 hypothetical protein YPJ_pJARS3651 [Yersinia pestis Java 9]AJJ37981.1 hypothetical protein CH62_4367 [Yersinia pestis]